MCVPSFNSLVMVTHSFRTAIPPREANKPEGPASLPVTRQPLPRLRGPDTRGAEPRRARGSSHSRCYNIIPANVRAPSSAARVPC